MTRSTRNISLSALAIGALLLVWWLLSREENPPPSDDSSADRGATAWSDVEIPKDASHPIEKLRLQTTPGGDRFLVESQGEETAVLLSTLRELLGSRERDPAKERTVFSTSFTTTELAPKSTTSRTSRPFVEAREGTEFSTAGSKDWIRLAKELTAPARLLDRVEFKVIAIDGEAGRFTATVLFAFAGSAEKEQRLQWSGQARLRFEKENAASALLLSSWTTTRLLEVRLDQAPFEDVTEAALGENASWKTLLSLPLDHFRERLDAASGITVYGHQGISVGDVNGDGFDDIYVAFAGGLPNCLLLGQPDAKFLDVSKTSGADVLDNTSQALILDLDNASAQDLFLVTDFGLHVLLGDGTGRFSPLPEAVPRSIVGRSTPVSVAAADYDRDGNLDVYIASYVFWRGGTTAAGTAMPIPYHEAHNGAQNFLLRGRGDGRFEDVTESSGLHAGNRRFSFAVSWGDYDGDGHPDLYVANDFGSNNLYRNRGDGTFEERTDHAGVRDVGAGMSVAWEDYDNDGYLDLYVGNMFSAAGRRVTSQGGYKSQDPKLQQIYRRHARGNSLFRNRGDGTFTDVSLETGAYFGRWAWASDFVDIDLDGHLDLYVQNGFLTAPRTQDL